MQTNQNVLAQKFGYNQELFPYSIDVMETTLDGREYYHTIEAVLNNNIKSLQEMEIFLNYILYVLGAPCLNISAYMLDVAKTMKPLQLFTFTMNVLEDYSKKNDL